MQLQPLTGTILLLPEMQPANEWSSPVLPGVWNWHCGTSSGSHAIIVDSRAQRTPTPTDTLILGATSRESHPRTVPRRPADSCLSAIRCRLLEYASQETRHLSIPTIHPSECYRRVAAHVDLVFFGSVSPATDLHPV